MNVKVKLFGVLADAAGRNELNYEAVNDTAALQIKILQDYPALSGYPYVIAVSRKVANENVTLSNGDTVALLPPFAGG